MTLPRRPSLLLVALAVLAVVPAEATRDVPVLFRFRPPGDAHTVTVAGTFNDWDSRAEPLGDGDGDGVWEATVRLAPGNYQYKFVVNTTDWFTDEFAGEFAPDGFGGRNSVLHVGSEPLTVGEPGAADRPAEGTPVTFRFAPGAGNVNAVSVAGSFNGWDAAADPLADPDRDGLWEVTLRLEPGEYTYQFVVDGDDWRSAGPGGDTEDDGFGGRRARLTVGTDPIAVGSGARTR